MSVFCFHFFRKLDVEIVLLCYGFVPREGVALDMVEAESDGGRFPSFLFRGLCVLSEHALQFLSEIELPEVSVRR